MSAPRSAGQLRLVLISMPAGFLVLVGGGVALALGERAIGACLIAAALLTVLAGLILMLRVKTVTMRQVQAMQDRRRADTEEAFRPGRQDRPPFQQD